MLHPVINDTPYQAWCGPAAVCTITGRPMSEVRAEFKQVRKEWGSVAPLKGTNTAEVQEVLFRFGYLFRISNNPPVLDDMTLAHWLRKRRERKELTLVNVTHHWVVVEGHKFCDSHTMRPVFIREAPHRRKRVKFVYGVGKFRWREGKRREV